ncbi:MAG TPA: tRNA uridine-5-carboxymethylaminomethyl(34) synthesis enzyme MnmG, partial [Thermoanaerobaculia bacterium]|nr:tRNA uridine-5-carboxymethylaminomethyl(34) synthesis enzyme MnmG [Thermoanaerobaculia bacterium]
PATIGRMSCNPAVGGLAKGQVMREIDALGGAMGLVADRTAIQFKVLNASRGPAVRGLRCQSDKVLYAAELRRVVESAPRVTVAAGTAAGFAVEKGRLAGIVLEDGRTLPCRAAVVTTGTFLSGLVHVGESRRESGRWDEPPAKSLSGALSALGLRLGRMKTGTPPRVRAGSVDVSRMDRAAGDAQPVPFSFRSRGGTFPVQPQVDCWLTHTGERVHDLIRGSLPLSPLYSGRITGRGPRYCPSIEDKVVRFPDKARHQIFVEPEGLSTDWLYLNGLSMSLPPATQEQIVRLINGLERAEILRPAYAVEYDVVFPEQLDVSLETRALPGLFLAGQINGTSGYEEAAGQGLVAGANAARSAKDLGEALVLSRDEAYVGVMLDDLVTLGLDEPYRLLTSRAEHRLLLGADSAYARLTEKAVAFGLVAPEDAGPILEAEARHARVSAALEAARVTPDRATRARLAEEGVDVGEETSLAGLLRRPDLDVASLRTFLAETLGETARDDLAALDAEALDRVASELRYAGFLARERQTVARLKRAGGRRIPRDFVYRGVPGLSLEAVEKLERHRPGTLGQAARIPGVTAAAAALLLARLLARDRSAAA